MPKRLLAAATVLFAVMVSPAQTTPMPPTDSASAPPAIPVFLSTDIGNEVDDQFALTHLLLDPRVDLLAVSSANAPDLAPPSARTTFRKLTDSLAKLSVHQPQPATFEGASDPLTNTTTPQPSPAVTALIDLSQQFTAERPLNVVAIGSPTDVASAILTDPSITHRIRVVQMAFIDEHGKDEYNILNDPAAEQVILRSDVPLVIGPASVCRADLALSYDHARTLVADRGSIGAWLWLDYQTWYYRNVKPIRVNDFSKPWIIWDEITTAFLLGFTEQHTAPRPVMAADASFASTDTSRTVTWITHVDSDALWRSLALDIDNAAHPRSPVEGRRRLAKHPPMTR